MSSIGYPCKSPSYNWFINPPHPRSTGWKPPWHCVVCDGIAPQFARRQLGHQHQSALPLCGLPGAKKNMGNSPKDRIHPTKPWFLIQFLPTTLWTSNGFLICLAFFSWCFTFLSWVHIPWWTAKRAVVFSYSTKLLPLVATFGIWGINMVIIIYDHTSNSDWKLRRCVV